MLFRAIEIRKNKEKGKKRRKQRKKERKEESKGKKRINQSNTETQIK